MYLFFVLILDECRLEEKVVFGKSGKTETVKVYKWFFTHKEFFADSSAGGSELKSVTAPATVDEQAFYGCPVDYRIMVGGVVVRT